MPKLSKRKRRLTSFQIIILGFAGVILLGALLLMLPFSSKSGNVTPFHETLFTATSAACVTGLIVQDTASYWSLFGQSVILLLIQIGGMGVITIAVSLAVLSGRKISLMQRSVMQESISAPQTGGIVRLTGFIIKVSLIIEALGAAAMMPVFCRDFGAKGIWMAVFHAVSAFCNAGFDVMGTPEARFSSLTSYAGQPLVNLTVMLLIVVGGIGFLTWDDVRTNRLRLKRYRLQSKVVLTTSAVLIFVPAVFFFFFEFADLSVGDRIFASLFQSVTTRTAGFNTVDLTSMSGIGKCLMIVLMLIGGSPGSTAGGMKTTTVAVLFSNAVSVFRKNENAEMFRRRIPDEAVKNAAAILMLYVTLFVGGALVISMAEDLPLAVCLFETASAIGTVGLTLGLTPQLGLLSQIILIVLMFLGRVGGLTLIYATLSERNTRLSKLPQEKITVG